MGNTYTEEQLREAIMWGIDNGRNRGCSIYDIDKYIESCNKVKKNTYTEEQFKEAINKIINHYSFEEINAEELIKSLKQPK